MRSTLRPFRFALVWCAAVLALSGTAFADAAPLKNLQVLPKTTTKEQIKTIMKAQAKALGVECDFCHDVPDMAADTEHKKIARQMMKMTDEINAKWMKGWPGAEKHPVGCNTCHRGNSEPTP